MKQNISVILLSLALLVAATDSSIAKKTKGKDKKPVNISTLIPDGTPATDSIIFKMLIKNNGTYYQYSPLMYLDLPTLVRQTDTIQHPKAFVLNCIDSRVIPELLFKQTINNIFTGRTAGNMAVGDINGSLSYAVNFKHVTCIVVVGHSNCGAVQGGIDYYNGTFPISTAGPDLTALVARISDNAVKPTIANDPGGRFKPYISSNQKFVDAVAKTNVEYTAKLIKQTYPSTNVFKVLYSTYNGVAYAF